MRARIKKKRQYALLFWQCARVTLIRRINLIWPYWRKNPMRHLGGGGYVTFAYRIGSSLTDFSFYMINIF